MNFSKLKISIPATNQQEVRYTLNCLFTEFLGVLYEINVDENSRDFSIRCPIGKIVIRNCFFLNEEIDRLYTLENIPNQVDKAEFLINGVKLPIVSLYGEALVRQEEDDFMLESDVIASTFFMLSRWEEHVVKERDDHNRFSAKSSLAYKEDFLERPIVNEYVELLWNLLVACGYDGPRKKREFRLVPTHDVDTPYKWWTPFAPIKTFGSSLKNKNYKESYANARHIVLRKDPFDTYHFLMNQSEKMGVKSHFFFMVNGKSKYDGNYSIQNPRILRLIDDIKARGHIIGLHPSYDSYADKLMLLKEKEKLEDVAGVQIVSGRQHYLRTAAPYTMQNWDDVGMQWDSTMSYADKSGFRCGVCYPFNYYNFLTRKKLSIVERPLIVMETTLISYERFSNNQAIEKQNNLKSTVKKYNGEFVFLWHNSSFNHKLYLGTSAVAKNMYE